MITAIIPHPAFSPAFPRMTVRELLLAAQCVSLKSQVIEQQTQITALEESSRSDSARIAALIKRNKELTAAIHRTACAG